MNNILKLTYFLLLQLISLSLAKEDLTKYQLKNHDIKNSSNTIHLNKTDAAVTLNVIDETYLNNNKNETVKNLSIKIPTGNAKTLTKNTLKYIDETANACELSQLPVLENIAKGIDIQTLDMLPTILTNRNGFAKTIFNFTCLHTRPITNPLDSNEIINQPDQVVSIIPNSNAISLKLYKTLSDYVDANIKAVGLTTNNSIEKTGHFIDSVGYSKLKNRLRETKEYVIETHLVKNGYLIKLETPEVLQNSLSSSFAFDLDRLSPDFTRYWNLYEIFFDYYGTHYFSEAQVGEMTSMRTTIRKDYLNSGLITKKTLLAFTGEEFFRKTQKNFNSKQLKSQVANDEHSFSKNIKTKFFWFGGNWRHGEPGLIHGGQLVGLHTLVRDPLLKSALQKAITIRGAQSSLADLEDTISGGDDFDYEEAAGSIFLSGNEKETLKQLNEYFAIVPGGRESYDDNTLGKNIEELASLKATIEAKAGL